MLEHGGPKTEGKLKREPRDGAHVSKKYHPPITPCDRLFVSTSVDAPHAATQLGAVTLRAEALEERGL